MPRSKVVGKRNRGGVSAYAWVASRALVATLLLAGVCACGGDADDRSPAAVPEFEGLSPEEMQRQAESMTPEQAESLGIVDTTITVGAPIGADSVVQPGVIPGVPADSAPGPAQ